MSVFAYKRQGQNQRLAALVSNFNFTIKKLMISSPINVKQYDDNSLKEIKITLDLLKQPFAFHRTFF